MRATQRMTLLAGTAALAAMLGCGRHEAHSHLRPAAVAAGKAAAVGSREGYVAGPHEGLEQDTQYVVHGLTPEHRIRLMAVVKRDDAEITLGVPRQ